MRLRARALPISKDSQLQEGEEIQMRPQLCRMLDLQVRHVLLPGPWRTPHRKRHHGSLSLKEIQEDGVSSLHDKKNAKKKSVQELTRETFYRMQKGRYFVVLSLEEVRKRESPGRIDATATVFAG